MQLVKPHTVILVTGACGQIGTELVKALRQRYGKAGVIATDIKPERTELLMDGQYHYLDVMDKSSLGRIVREFGVTHIYHLAAVLSATGENKPLDTWDVNMASLLNILEAGRINEVEQIFWPSSIAVFGPASPKNGCPQNALPNPKTVYGISKCSGEHWCAYYRDRYGMDIRSLRFPGLISASAKAGGGTTDYAVDIFHQAITERRYTCFLKENTCLPMMYMPDAVRATLELMDAPLEKVKDITAYNLAAMSFTPAELAAEIQTYLPDFQTSYAPDHRQKIADSWPYFIDDKEARQDWGWVPFYNMFTMTMDMMEKLKQKR